jgi:hypothetical protein
VEGNKNNWFFKPVCRDSLEIYHCLLIISSGKSWFKSLIIKDQLFMTTVSETPVAEESQQTGLKTSYLTLFGFLEAVRHEREISNAGSPS